MTSTETIAAVLAAHTYRESTAGRAAHCSCGTWLLGNRAMTHRHHQAAAIDEALGSSDDGLRERVAAVLDGPVGTEREEGRWSEPRSWIRGARHMRVAVRAALNGATS